MTTRLHYDNLLDYAGVALTASSEVATLPVENVIDPRRTSVYRSNPTIENVLSNPNDFSHADWAKNGCTTGSPTSYGGLSFYPIIENAGTITPGFQHTDVDFTAGHIYRVHVSIKKGTRNTPFIGLSGINVGFNFTTGLATIATPDCFGMEVLSLGSDAYTLTFLHRPTTTHTTFSINAGFALTGSLGATGMLVAAASVEDVTTSIVVDLGSAKAVTSLIVLDHTISLGASVFLSANATDSWGSPSYDGEITYSADTVYGAFASQTYRYFRIAFAADEAFDIGRIFLGTYVTPARDPDFNGYEATPVDRTITQEALSGTTYSWERDPYLEVELKFSKINETQKAQFVALQDAVGTHTAFFFYHDSLHPLPLYCKLGKLPKRPVSGGVTGAHVYDMSLSLREQL